METLCEALRDPLFDEQSENRWFEKADTDAATFVATLELWLSLTADLQNWMLDEESSDEAFNVPGKYVRLTSVVQQLLGDGPSGHRLGVRSFDTTPLSDLCTVFSDFEAWLDFELEKKEQAEKWGDDLSDYEVDDQFPMSMFDLNRIVTRATKLVERALVGQVKDYRYIRDQRRHSGYEAPFEFVTPITREQLELGPLVANGWVPSSAPAPRSGDDDKNASGQADSKADSRKKRDEKYPENPKVYALATFIKKRYAPRETRKSLALQFTDGDEKLAANLLRQLRGEDRYAHLLDGTPFEKKREA